MLVLCKCFLLQVEEKAANSKCLHASKKDCDCDFTTTSVKIRELSENGQWEVNGILKNKPDGEVRSYHTVRCS